MIYFYYCMAIIYFIGFIFCLALLKGGDAKYSGAPLLISAIFFLAAEIIKFGE